MRAQTKATVAVIMTGVIGAHSLAPTVGELWTGSASIARCDMVQRVASFSVSVDCESGSVPPLGPQYPALWLMPVFDVSAGKQFFILRNGFDT